MELSAARLYTLVYQTYSVIISLYRLSAGRHEAVQTPAKDPEGPARVEKTPVKINGISKYIIGFGGIRLHRTVKRGKALSLYL